MLVPELQEVLIFLEQKVSIFDFYSSFVRKQISAPWKHAVYGFWEQIKTLLCFALRFPHFHQSRLFSWLSSHIKCIPGPKHLFFDYRALI